MRRRPVAVYRVIDEAELLGEPEAVFDHGPATRTGSLGLTDGLDDHLRPRGGVRGRAFVTSGIAAAGLLALIAATLISTGSAHRVTLPRRPRAGWLTPVGAKTSKLVRLAARAQARIARSVRRPSWSRTRKRPLRRAAESRSVRAQRPPRRRALQAFPAPPGAAPVNPDPSPASEFGFER